MLKITRTRGKFTRGEEENSYPCHQKKGESKITKWTSGVSKRRQRSALQLKGGIGSGGGGEGGINSVEDTEILEEKPKKKGLLQIVQEKKWSEETRLNRGGLSIGGEAGGGFFCLGGFLALGATGKGGRREGGGLSRQSGR